MNWLLSVKIPKPILYLSAGTAIITGAIFIKEHVGGPRYTRYVPIESKVAIVTGANTGIGKEVALELAKREAKVYLACRNLRKCEETRKEIVLTSKNKNVYCRECDLASLESIRNFVTKFKEEQEKLDILINNAGVMRTPKGYKTKEGFEMQLGVNHMGHFLLTNLLLDNLKAAAPSRIVNVSSIAYRRGNINKNDLNCDKSYEPGDAYAQSKLANILFTKELAERLQGTKVTVNAVHPGLVDTAIIRHMSFYNSWIATILIKPFIWPFIKGPCQGAQPVIFAALDPDISEITGKYFSDNLNTEVTAPAKDMDTAKWLWAVSEKWTKL